MPQKGCVHNLLPKPALGYLQLVTKNTSALISSGICKTSYHFDRREMLKTVIILSKVTSPELTRFNELVTACSFIDDRKLHRKIYSSQQIFKDILYSETCAENAGTSNFAFIPTLHI